MTVNENDNVVDNESQEEPQKGGAADFLIEQYEKSKKLQQLAFKAKSAFVAVKTSVSGIVALLTNPVTWIVILVIVVVALLGIAGGATYQTVGRNDNADGCFGIGGSSSVQVDDNADWHGRANSVGSWMMSQSWQFLGGKQMTKKQVGALLGNFIAESGITFAKAERKNGNESGSLDKMTNERADVFTRGTASGLGLVQWTHNPGRAGNLLDMARSMGKQWWEPEPQLALLKKELDEGHYGAELVSAGFADDSKSVEELTTIFHDVFEKSADKTMTKRHESAQQFMSSFAPTSVSDGGSGGGSCVKAGNIDTSDIVGLAVSMSYESSQEAAVGGDYAGKSRAKPEYIAAKKKASDETGPDPLGELYADCGRFVATVVKNTKDKEFPWGATSNQSAYLRNSPKWVAINKKSDLKPGDVLVTGGHIMLYIGDHKGVDSLAHASQGTHVAYILSANYVNDSLVDTSGRPYTAFRFKG